MSHRFQQVDEVAARELSLFCDNDFRLYQMAQAIIANLKRKIARGVYDPELAVKGWMHLFDEAARRYCKEFGGTVAEMFPRALRMHLARERAEHEHAAIVRGEYEERT